MQNYHKSISVINIRSTDQHYGMLITFGLRYQLKMVAFLQNVYSKCQLCCQDFSLGAGHG
jgi:hypothetical protein